MAMRDLYLVPALTLAALSGCGLENFFGNVGRSAFARPASVIRGSAWVGVQPSQIAVLDGDGNEVAPFASSVAGSAYELRLPSSTYSMLRVQGHYGNMVIRALVPSLGKESAVEGVDLDARAMTETLLVEARLSGDNKKFRQLTPAAYVGDGVTNGTRTLIRKDMDGTGANHDAQDLLRMVERFVARADPTSTVTDPDFFGFPTMDPTTKAITASPVSASYLSRSPFDYDADGSNNSTTAVFDAKLSVAAQLYSPEGCPDPNNIRLLFTVDFNANSQDGNCAVVNRFKWVTDKPGKQMFFTGGVHEESTIPPLGTPDRPRLNALLGAWVPNQLPMYDDGTNGDEVAGDNIWTITFDVPRGVRIGYKYTWGTQGAAWTGTEEWPGNQRLIEVVDVGGDGIVYRRDVFGDEATNKDKANLNSTLSGNVITWTTDLHGCGPEVHEQKFTPHNMCVCGAPADPAWPWTTPESVGPLTVACGP